MTQSEKDDICMYFVHQEIRYANEITEMYNRLLSRKSDSLDLFELILARERAEVYHKIMTDVFYILHLTDC